MNSEDWRKNIVKAKLRFSRGRHWITFLESLVLISLWLKIFNFPDKTIFFLAPVVILSFYLVGWFDEKKGVWKIETAYTTKELTPFFKKMDEKVDEINILIEKKMGNKNEC